jgi:hypothetical protein
MRQSLVAAGVDAAPPAAIVRIAAQPIRLVNVIGVAVRIAWVAEYSRHLACGELVRLLHRHHGNVLALGLASSDGASQRRAKRNPNTYGSFQWPLLCAQPAPPQLIPSQRSDYVGTGSNGAQIKNLIYFSGDGRASEIIRPRAGGRSGDLFWRGSTRRPKATEFACTSFPCAGQLTNLK